MELKGLEVESSLHFFQSFIEDVFVFLGNKVGLVEQTDIIGRPQQDIWVNLLQSEVLLGSRLISVEREFFVEISRLGL